MSVRPLDLQININSALSLAQREGLKISQFETKQMNMINKQVQDQHKMDSRVNLIEESEKSRKMNHYKISSDNHNQHETDTDDPQKEEKQSRFAKKQSSKEMQTIKKEKNPYSPTPNINLLA